ncbi:amino acid adenylation domain-containing protein [Streptomyces rubiginosohelvolus]
MAAGTAEDDCTDDAPEEAGTTTLRLPALAEDVGTARVLRMYHAPGDRVTEGDPLYECETDKVTVDIEAAVGGELVAWLVSAGDTVEAGTAVAEMRTGAPDDAPSARPTAPVGTGADGTDAEPAGTGVEARKEKTPGPPRVSPLARKHARLNGLAPEELAGIPRRGSMLTPSDIDRHLAARQAGAPGAERPDEDVRPSGAAALPPDAGSTGGSSDPRTRHRPSSAAQAGFDDVGLSETQVRLNKALDRSRAEVTASTVSTGIDAAALHRAARRFAAQAGVGFASDYQVLVRLAALTAREHPRLRARRIGRDTLRVFHAVNIGVAVATNEADLVVAGVPGADEGDFASFARRWTDGVEASLAGRSTVDGTATLLVSSLDEDGVLSASPVVVPPAVATLFLGAAPPGSEGRRLLTLAYDHGVLNGREAARFLAGVRQRVGEAGGPEPEAVPPEPAPEPASRTGRLAMGTAPSRPDPAGHRDGPVRSRTDASSHAPGTASPATLARLVSLIRDLTGGAPAVDRPLGEQGLTSSMAVRLSAAVNEAFGTRLPATAVWRHPTPVALALAVDAAAPPSARPDPSDGPAATGVHPVEEAPAASSAGSDDRAAVVGMACSFPGGEGLDAFWDLLERGGCAVTEIPPGRVAGLGPASDGSPAPRAGLLAAPYDFDPESFGITDRQARSMDPQQRLLLELSRYALEDAGLVPADLAGTRTGVFVGASSYDFRERTLQDGSADGYATLGTFPTFLANRISYHYDFTGPSITVDTACSASLTALALAVAAIERGDCEVALVGGVNLLGNSFNQDAFQRAGMLSPGGLSRAFDADADGYVRGEGAAWLVLKPLRRAVADGDPVSAVVLGAATNHGGRASGPTAPSPRAQSALIRDVLTRSGLRGRDLGYVEAHGTGTPLGDPIEWEALRVALDPGGEGPAGDHGSSSPDTVAAGRDGRTVPVGSVKANIGHLEGAAGLAGVVKALLAMRYGVIPGTPHFRRINPEIDLSGSVLRVADRTAPWPGDDGPRRAAVSSFGIGGSNAHVILEQHAEAGAERGTDGGTGQPAAEPARSGDGPFVLPLSAGHADDLPVVARDLVRHLDREVARGVPVRLDAWARTLQTGRQAMDARIALVLDGPGELRAALCAVAEGAAHPGVVRPPGLAGPETELPGEGARAFSGAAPLDPVRRWLSGAALDWETVGPRPLSPGGPPLPVPRRVSLPGRPFRRRTLAPPWEDGSPATGITARSRAADASVPGGAPSPTVLAPSWVNCPAPTGPTGAPGAVLLVHDDVTKALATVWADQWPAAAGPRAPRQTQRPLTLSHLADPPHGLPDGPLRIHFLVGGGSWQPGVQARAELRSWMKALVRHAQMLDSRGAASTFTLVTTGLAAPGQPPTDGAALQGALLGALRSLPHESPLLTVAALDVPGPHPARAPSAADVSAEPCTVHAPLVSLAPPSPSDGSAARRWVETLAPVPEDATAPDGGGHVLGGTASPWPADAPALLLFGGAGGVGGALAVQLAARRGARLVLVGRSAHGDRVEQVLSAVRAAGGSARYLRGDVCRDADVEAAFAHCQEVFGRVDGVLHLAGATRDALLHHVAADALDPGADAKVAGVGPLHRARLRRPGTPLVLFSSFLGTFGSQGGLEYAAANACLDRLATALDAPESPTRAVAWGVWHETGMAVRHGAGVLAAFPGLEAFGPEEACAAMEECLRGSHPYTVVLGGRPRALDGFRPAGSVDTGGTPAAPTTVPAASMSAPAKGPSVTAPHVPQEALPGHREERSRERADAAERIRSAIRAVLRRDLPLPGDLPWRELGVDSLLHVELTAALSAVFGPLAGTTLHEYGTIDALAGHLSPSPAAAPAPAVSGPLPTPGPSAGPGPGPVPVEASVVARPRPAAPAETAVPTPRNDAAQRPVAVIGLAGRYPGARDLDAFWQLLAQGRSPVREVPPDRWDWRVAQAFDASTTRWGCFLEDWDRFDAELFRIPPRDAAVLDPQERQFLQTAWEAFETSGYAPSSLSRGESPARVGVYVGVTSHSNLLAQRDARLTGADNAEYGITAYASVANRVSYAFGLNGPSLAVDTMCSSSLTAVHLACQALATDDADIALAGGVHLFLHPDRFGGLASVGMTSQGPLTRAFGASGDGFVPGEGVGALVLKPLDRAVADSDTVYAVLTGSAVNHGGQGSGYTVPSPVAQADLVTRALHRAGAAPHSVGYIEAHGTGTELGDPIELRALEKAFTSDPPARPGSVRIGSVKSNIGHGEAVAGIAGLTKAILQLRHRRLVPSLHARPENPRLPLDGGPFRVQHHGEEWRPADGCEVRRAAVSSFGAGGSNAHVVVEEYVEDPAGPLSARAGSVSGPVAGGPVVVPLSAPDAVRLAELAGRLAGVLEAPSETLTGPVSLPDVAATLRSGRAPWPSRAAVVCAEPAQLVSALRALAEGTGHPALFTADNTPDGSGGSGGSGGEDADGNGSGGDDAHGLARAWVAEGIALPESGGPYRRVALPTTPFAGVRHAVPGPASGAVEAALLSIRADRALPLVPAPLPVGATVPLRLPEGHPWVAGHVVDGAPLVPAALALESVWEALLAKGTNPYGAALRDVTFLAPWHGPALSASVAPEPVASADATGDSADGEASWPVAGAQPGAVPAGFAVRSGDTVVVRGTVAPPDAGPSDRLDALLDYTPDRLAAALRLDGAVPADDFYAVLDAHGFRYGPPYRAVERAVRAGSTVVARLRTDGQGAPAGRPVLHPAVLDGAFQAAGYAVMAPDAARPAARFRPFSVDRIVVHRPGGGDSYVHVRPVREDTRRGVHVLDVAIVAASGERVADIEGFVLRSEPLDRRAVRDAAGVTASYGAQGVSSGSGRDAAAVTGAGPGGAAEPAGPVPPVTADRLEAYAWGWTDAPGAPVPAGDRSVLLIGVDDTAHPLTRVLRGRADAFLPWSALPADDPQAALAALDGALGRLGPDAGVLVVLDEGGLGRPAVAPTTRAAEAAYQGFSAAVTLPLFAVMRALVSTRSLASGQVRLLAAVREREAAAAQHALHGLIATVAGETGRFGIGLLTLDPARIERAGLPDAVYAELERTPRPCWVRLDKDGARREGTLVAVERPDTPVELRPDGCYLVLGGTSGLGRAVAASLRHRLPDATVVVAGRSAGQAERPGTRDVRLACDVTDPDAVTRLVAELDRRGLRVNGVVSTAGVLRDGFLRTKDAGDVEAVCRVKLLGALALDAALADHPLDFFVLSSSVAVHVGNQGQSDYAFANGFLNGFALDRARAAGRPGRTLAVGWPVLAGGGMLPPGASLDFLRESYGLVPLPVAEAAEELWRLLARGGPGNGSGPLVLAHGDLGRWAGATGAAPAPVPAPSPAPALPAADSPVGRGGDEGPPATHGATASGTTEPSDAQGVLDAVVRWLAEQVTAVMGLPAETLGADTDLTARGVDSIGLTRLARRLEGALGRMPRSTLYDHDTIGELARGLLSTHTDAVTAVIGSTVHAADGVGRAPAASQRTPARTAPGAPAAAEPSVEQTGQRDRTDHDPCAAWPLTDRHVPLWMAEQSASPYAPYNLSLAWRLPAGYDRGLLARALSALYDLHPALSRRVGTRSGTLVFLPARDGDRDAGDGPYTSRRVESHLLAGGLRREADRRLPLDSGPASRFVLWDDGTGRYVLQLTVHHLVADGRSVEVLGEDLHSLLLDGAVAGGGRDTTAPAAGYRSFGQFVAQEEAVPGDDGARRAWRERLRGAPGAPRFPGGSPGARDWQAGHAEYRMPGALRDALRGAAASAGVSDFAVQLAAYALAVGAVSGTRDFLVSVPTYGRPGPEYDRTVGHFVNSVAVRVAPVADRPVRRWLGELHDEIRSAVSLADLPYPSAVELCREAGGEEAVPNLTFAYQNWPRTAPDHPLSEGPLAERVFIQGQGGQWDLGLELTDTPDGVEILANHRLQALTSAEVDAFVGTWFTLAGALAADLDAPTGDLLGAESLTLPGRFRRLAARHPHEEAVRDASGGLSYAEVDRRSARVARAVLAHGVPAGQPVAVLVERGTPLPVALLGVLRAGCPYVPLDASYPAERIAMILQDAGCTLAVTEQGAGAALLADRGLSTVLLDDLPEDDGGSGTEPVRPSDPEAPAYVMFTSGSTGRPKGVAVSHRNVLHALDAFRDLTGWGRGDRLLAVTTASFDISVLELFLPLASGGGCVVVADRDSVRDASRLDRLLDEEDISLLQATPSGWQLLLDSGWRGRPGLTALCGGEPMPPALARDLGERVGALWNAYGPTEATIWSTAARLEADGPVVLGAPIGATELLLTVDDASGRPMPARGTETGELWIGGPGVAAGYWHRPEETARRFTGHPLSPGHAGRWFRTGDLVRRDADGGLRFVGRADGQVKIRGHRLDLGEIEAVLTEHPRIGRAVAVAHGEGASATLTAFLVPSPGSPAPCEDELRDLAALRLPEWMLPGRLLVTEALPRTPNGKTDRAALTAWAESGGWGGRERDGSPAAGSSPAVPPGTAPTGAAGSGVPTAPVGHGVTEEWRRLLGTEDLARDRTFFSSGGNSLLLGRLYAALRDRFPDAGLELGDLFAHPTLAAQEALLHGRLGTPAPPRQPREPHEPREPRETGSWSGGAPYPGTGVPSPQQTRQERRRAFRTAVTETG